MVNIKQYQKAQRQAHIVNTNPQAPKKTGLDAVREQHARAVANAPRVHRAKPRAFSKITK